MVLQAGLDEVARLLERADPPSCPAATPAYHALAGIAWHLRTGGGRCLRAFRRGARPTAGSDSGSTRPVREPVAGSGRRRRRRCGCRSEPRLAIIDTQSVKGIGVRGPRGYDGTKKVVGRKRVVLVDAEGHVLALAVVPADVRDRDTLSALEAGKEQRPNLRLAILDGAFTAERCREWCNIHGLRHSVVEKDPDQKGFVVLERRCRGSFDRRRMRGESRRVSRRPLSLAQAAKACTSV
nr:transposase [Methylobacterium sp. 2A]